MNDIERFKLIAGPYRTPKLRRGEVVTCLIRDYDCVVMGLTDARIPWPRGKKKNARAVSLVCTPELARAIKTESNQAIAYWWGITWNCTPHEPDEYSITQFARRESGRDAKDPSATGADPSTLASRTLSACPTGLRA